MTLERATLAYWRLATSYNRQEVEGTLTFQCAMSILAKVEESTQPHHKLHNEVLTFRNRLIYRRSPNGKASRT